MNYPSLRRFWLPAGFCALLAATAFHLTFLQPGKASPALAGGPALVPSFFVPNGGQAAPGVSFLLRAPRYRAEFVDREVRFVSGAGQWGVRFEGVHSGARWEAGEPTGANVNYLLGEGPSQWLTGLPAYSALIYREVYPGIDLVYRLVDSSLKAEFRLRPGADPGQIRWVYESVEEVRIAADGALLVRAGMGQMREEAPRIYQVRQGVRTEVAGGFRRIGEHLFGFWTGRYDPSLELVIDPVLSYSTRLGGSGMEVVRAMAVDGAGNVYVAGYTDSPNFPLSNALQGVRGGGVEAFVAKLNAAGNALLYCTYLGGSGDDRAFGITVDGGGNAYVAGWTYSTNFPVTQGVLQRSLRGGRDAFVARLNPVGNALFYSTYLGGASHDSANAIAVDSSGNAVVAGDSYSSDFPLAYPLRSFPGGRQDAFVAKLNSTASSLLWSTYLGGSGDDRALGVAYDTAGAVYVTGGTFSTDFPVQQALQAAIGGGQDAFVAKISSDGRNLVYSTYLGGSGGTATSNEAGMAIGVDLGGNAYVAGGTPSLDFPVANALRSAPAGGGMDAFVAKLNPSGTSLVYSTYLGGSSQDYALALAVAPSGLTAVSGYTASADFPVSRAVQSAKSGTYDAFVARLRPDGSALELSTYWGGSDSEAAYAVALDRAGNLWLAGQTMSADYPLKNAVQAADPGSGSAFLARIVDLTPVAAFRGADGSPRLTLYGATLLPNAGGNISSEVSVWQSSTADVYVAGTNASSCVYLNIYRLTTHSWAGWLRVGCGMTGNAVVAASETGEAWIVARDTGFNYYLSRYIPGTGFTAWTKLGGGFTSEPVAAVSKDDSLYVAGRKTDGRVYAGRWINGSFQGWAAASSGPLVDGKPAIACGSDAAAYVAVRATDRSTWIARFQGSSWGTWYSAGGVAYGGPEIAATGGFLYVTVTNVNGLAYIRPFREGTSNGWQSWVSSGGNLRRASIAAANGRFYVAGRALDNSLWWYESGVGWTAMSNGSLTGGELNAGPR
ncbi:MAG: DUF7948 domain-containing protein [Bryobacteraceae bacterium]